MTKHVSFGVITDCQYADIDDTDVRVMGAEHLWYYNRNRQSPEKLKEAIEEFNRNDLAFIVHLGDFTNSDLNDADVLNSILAKASAPVWHVLGNHDVDQLGGNYQLAVDKYQMPDRYYSKSLGGYRFIVLDTNEVGVIETTPGSDEWQEGKALVEGMKANGDLNAYDWNGAVGPEQLAWLDAQLNEAKSGGEEAVIFAHHPVFPPGVLNALNQTEILAVIDAHDNVKAFINGHNHNGAFGVRSGVPYITVPGVVNGETNAFGIVSLVEGRLEIRGYGRVQDLAVSI